MSEGAVLTREHALETLARTLEGLSRELRPGQPVPQPRPGSSLDRDLGLDSLSRVELLARLEEGLGVRLAPGLAAEAETVADLLDALVAAPSAGAGPPERVIATPEAPPAAAPLALPESARTLVEVLDWFAERAPERVQVTLYGDEETPREISFAELQAVAERAAAGLQAHGLLPGQAVAIMLPTGLDFLATFFGILVAGGVPVPLYPPTRPSQLEEHLRRQAGILRRADAPLLVTLPAARRLTPFLRGEAPCLRHVLVAEELQEHPRQRARGPQRGEDAAFYQFTSGSTGDPKGVVLSHANLLANVRAVGLAVGPRPDDVFVSWLPLYHDMGLIGAVLATLYHAVPLVLLSPLAFLTRPARWLEAIARHRGTLSAAPNFAYELCVRKIPDPAALGLDLRCWRMTLNGAEPVSPVTIARFQEQFGPCGFAPEAMTPTYGLAENSVGLTMTPIGRGPRLDRVRRSALGRGRAEPVPAEEKEDVAEFVSCGPALPTCELRVVDETRRELPDRRQGHVQFRGPSATSGYFRHPEATARLIGEDGWLDSGDWGYVAGGELYVTGRVKDVVIRAGRNIYPHELEEAVGRLPGVRQGCVAVFGARRPDQASEALVVLVEVRLEDPAEREALRARIVALGHDLLGEPPDDVVLAAPHTVLKTSSGKVRRAACRELYEQGRLGRAERAAWLQLLRLQGIGLAHSALRRLERAGGAAYGGRFWTAFGLGLSTSWTGALTLPTLSLRWRAARRGARLFFRLAGLTPRVIGAERLPARGPCVVVSNHASYLDGALLAAVLPGEPAIVVKRELADDPVLGPMLKRTEALFVERFQREASAADARRLQEELTRGRVVAVFPEGTCLRFPGLLPFHLSAFLAAAETGAPVLPLVIRGSRSALRPDTWLPSPGELEVEVGEPLRASQAGWQGAIELRDRARAWILPRTGEPDLAHVDMRDHLTAPA